MKQHFMDIQKEPMQFQFFVNQLHRLTVMASDTYFMLQHSDTEQFNCLDILILNSGQHSHNIFLSGYSPVAIVPTYRTYSFDTMFSKQTTFILYTIKYKTIGAYSLNLKCFIDHTFRKYTRIL